MQKTIERVYRAVSTHRKSSKAARTVTISYLQKRKGIFKREAWIALKQWHFEEKEMSSPEDFNQLMQESRDELANLRAQLQSLMVKFGLRALKTYQAARIEPLRAA
ncbi:MAG: hypothetical protein QW744_01800, partial [Candidatus Bathyarchaeia archaeon]